MKEYHIGIISAMQEEIGSTLKHIKNTQSFEYGDLKIYNGFWVMPENSEVSIKVSLAWSGWGKVSAARALTKLINRNDSSKIDLILFTGVAGATNKELKQWDVLIPKEVIQYDMDARPLFDRFVIPALKKSKLVSSNQWSELVFNALRKAKKNNLLNKFGNISRGLIGTADKFISTKSDLAKINELLPSIQAVEMEGAAVAQVCEQEKIPWVVVRTISDNANDSAAEVFSDFLKSYEANSHLLLVEIIKEIIISGI